MFKCVFGFAEHQEKGTCGLGYKLTLTGNSDYAILNKGNAINNAKIKINSNDWYVPHYTPSLSQRIKLMNQIVKKLATEFHYPEESVFMKEVYTQICGLKNWALKKVLTFLYGFMQLSNKMIGNTIKIYSTILLVDCLMLLLNAS